MPKQSRQDRSAEMRAARNDAILRAAVHLAKTDGYQWITRERVAALAGVSPASVNNAFGRMVELKRAVMREAVSLAIVEIVAQGLADNQKDAVEGATPELREKVARYLAA